LKVLQEVLCAGLDGVVVAEVESRLSVLAWDRGCCELLFTKEEGVLAEYVLAEVLRQINCLAYLDNKVHSLPNQILWLFRYHIIRHLRLTIYIYGDNINLDLAHDLRILSDYGNDRRVVH